MLYNTYHVLRTRRIQKSIQFQWIFYFISNQIKSAQWYKVIVRKNIQNDSRPVKCSCHSMLLHKEKKNKRRRRTKRGHYSTNHDALTTYSTISIFLFDGCPVIFNTHTINLTKSISSLSNSKSNNYTKSDRRVTRMTRMTREEKWQLQYSISIAVQGH